MKHHKSYFWLVLVVLVIATVFRFQHLRSVPSGLYPDEAMNGNNALHALETGQFKVFYPENNGREGLFINLQAVSVAILGNQPFSLRVVSAIIGVLTVLGLYFLSKELFNREIGLLASFLMAISFWHVNFSRLGFRVIMAPFFLVWMAYFLWRGIRSSHIGYFIASGIALGLGFYTYIAFRGIPIAIVITLAAYWYFLRRDIRPEGGEKYAFLKGKLKQGFIALIISTAIISLPLVIYFLTHPQDLLGRSSQVSILNAQNPGLQLLINFGKTITMFNFSGDFNWRHNVSGSPLLVWPIGIFFIIGFVKSILKLWKLKEKHGHLSIVQTFLLATFFIGLAPVFISNEGIPHALRALIVAPIVFIFAAEGLWWLFQQLRDWYGLRDPHPSEMRFVSTFVIVFFLTSLAVVEYNRYFNVWAQNPEVAGAFNTHDVELGRKINALPRNKKVYVVVNADGVSVREPDSNRSIPMPAQTVMYITDTWTAAKQKAKNIYYLTKEEYAAGSYDQHATIVKLND